MRRRDTMTEDHEEEPFAGLFTLTRRMENEDEDQFDVDITIMDFLAYKATQLIFEWRSTSNPYASDLPSALATMTAEFRSFLSQKHYGRRLSKAAAFRSRLLQFALLFSHRLNHDQTWTTEESLNSMRASNKERGAYWHSQTRHAPALRQPFDSSSEFPLSLSSLAENRNHLASVLGQPQNKRRWVTDVQGTPSLHCLLALFIELTAARVELGDWDPSDGWMDLVGQFMLQAVVEEYLRNGASGEDTFNTIFAFGCPGTSRRPDDGADIQAMRMLFCTEENPREQKPGWTDIKRKYIAKVCAPTLFCLQFANNSQLLPTPDQSQSHLQSIQRAQECFPYSDFESNMLSFLNYLHKGLVKPDLIQVEEGRVHLHGNELGEAESKEMIRRMGL